MHRIKPNALFLIDGSSFLYRAYYAMRPLHTSKGVPVQATYGFCRMINKLIKDFTPKRMVLVWDTKGKTFRHDMYEAYKATRQAAPSDLGAQKEHIIEVSEKIGLCQIAQEGLEADDLIASLAKDYEAEQVIIISPDKDLRQLITENVLVFDPFKREIIDQEVFANKYGFPPERLLFYHALLGDASDNIPGVRGVGEKSASALAQTFASLDDLYANLDQVDKARVRKALESGKDDAYLSAQLFELKYQKIELTKDELAFDEKNLVNAIPFFRELEFTSILRELATAAGEAPAKKDEPAEVIINWETIVVRDEVELEKLALKLREAKFFAFDTETRGLDAMHDGCVGFSVACDKDTAYYVPIAHLEDGQLPIDVVHKHMGPIFADPDIHKSAHHGKFDAMVLESVGFVVAGIVFDSLLVANLLRKAWQKIGLKALSHQFLGEPMQTFAQVMGKKYKTFDQVPIDEGADYAAHDAMQTYKLYFLIKDQLEAEPKIKKYFYEMELPLSEILRHMEWAGIAVRPEMLATTGAAIAQELTKIEGKIRGAIDSGGIERVINLNSPKQVAELLFDELGLPAIKKSAKGARSTDTDVLGELSKVHPVPGLIMTYRELYKLKSTYIDALPGHIDQDTGRVHTVYGQTDIVTGRVSSSRPNLQNIPASRPHGHAIRKAFVAGEGRRFISADYSQIDLRVLAQLSQDPGLLEAYSRDEDVHSKTAGQIFGVAPGEVTLEQRQVGKRINFSIIYGLTPFGLSRDLGIKPSEAKEYIDKYFEQYPHVAQWMEEIVARAAVDGYVETFFGRRRYAPGLQEKNRTIYEQARRFTMNYPIQGTSAEIMKLAMLAVDKEIKEKNLDAQMILQIHDELIVECDESVAKEVEQLMVRAMEGVVEWDVPMQVTTRVGKDWAEITK